MRRESFGCLDRVLAYTNFGADAIDRTLGNPLGTTEHIPHGTDDTIFYPRSRKTARETLLQRIGFNMPGAVVGDEIELIGILQRTLLEKTSHWRLKYALDWFKRVTTSAS